MTTLFLNILFVVLQAGCIVPAMHKTYLIDGHLRLTWKEATEKCRESGMELVSIESHEENKMLKRLLEPGQNYDGYKIAEIDFWTGGMTNGEGGWIWTSNGKPLVYTDWAPGSPSDTFGRRERCLRLWSHHHLQWDDFICTARMHYICQRDLLSKDSSFNELEQALAMGSDLGEDDDFTSTFTSTLLGPTFYSAATHSTDVQISTSPFYYRVTPTFYSAAPHSTDVRISTRSFYYRVTPTFLPQSSYSLVMHSLRFYIFRTKKLRWLDAKEYCLKEEMNLAVVANSQEMCRISLFLKQNEIDHNCYWLRDCEPPENEWRDCRRWHHRRPGEDGDGGGGELIRHPRGIREAFERKCPLFVPSTGRVVMRECWLRCAFICERVEDT